MVTLIAAYNSEGCIGRCDAKCYNATCPDCDCICGGRNHGAGRQKAEQNTRELIEEWIEDYSHRHPDVERFVVPEHVQQKSFLDLSADWATCSKP